MARKSEKEKKNRRFFKIDHEYDKMLPASILAGLIGALLGVIPATLFAYLTGIVFYPLFAAAPLLAFLFNSLLKGGRDSRALIVTAVFSLASAYLTALSCLSALYAAAHSMSVFQILLLTGLELGKSGVLPESASAYIYPLVFTVFGVAVAWELFRGAARRGDNEAACEAEAGDEEAAEDAADEEAAEDAAGEEAAEDAVDEEVAEDAADEEVAEEVAEDAADEEVVEDAADEDDE